MVFCWTVNGCEWTNRIYYDKLNTWIHSKDDGKKNKHEMYGIIQSDVYPDIFAHLKNVVDLISIKFKLTRHKSFNCICSYERYAYEKEGIPLKRKELLYCWKDNVPINMSWTQWLWNNQTIKLWTKNTGKIPEVQLITLRSNVSCLITSCLLKSCLV